MKAPAAAILSALPLLLLSGCALLANKEDYGHPYTDEIANWRQFLGVALAVQYLLLTWGLWRARKRRSLSRLFLALLFLPLAWTIVGEWFYRLGIWVLAWGWPGQILAIVISLANGVFVGANIYPYVVGGLIFNDTRFLLLWGVPGVVGSYLTAFYYLRHKSNG